MIWENKSFTLDDGNVIHGQYPVDAPLSIDPILPRFFSVGTLYGIDPDGHKAPIKQFMFPLPGVMMQEAASAFPACYAAAIDKAKEEVAAEHRPGLVIPNGVPNLKLSHQQARRLRGA